MPHLAILGLDFQKTIVLFEINSLEFVKFQNFAKKQKCMNLGLKMPNFHIFCLEFRRSVVIFEFSTLEFL